MTLEKPFRMPVSTSLHRAGAIFFIALAFAHNLFISWLKWGDGLTDCGREFDLAKQLAEGKALYSDARYLFGPLAPSINGWLVRIFGVHLNVFIGAGIVTAALMCFVIYRLARCFTGRAESALITVSFLYICGFAQLVPNAIFNYVLPYSYSATYGTLMAFASLYFLVRHIQKGRSLDLFVSVAFLSLAALTKIEILFATCVPHCVFLATILWTRKFSARAHLLSYGMALVCVASVYSYFVYKCGGDVIYDNILFQLASPKTAHTNSVHMGLDDILDSVAGICYSSAVILGTVAVGTLLGWVALKVPRYRHLCGLLAMAAALYFYAILSVDWPFRIGIAGGILISAYFAWLWIRGGESRPAILSRLMLCVFATAYMSRMGLKVVAYHYGFFLLPAALVIFALWWFDSLPNWIVRNKAYGPIYRWAGAGVLMGLSYSHYTVSAQLYSMHHGAIQTSRGSLYLFDLPGIKTGTFYAAIVNRLAERMPPSTSMVVFPQGAQLTFLAGCENPMGQFGFTEPELNGQYDDEHLLWKLKKNPPDLILLIATETEISNKRFGVGYAWKSWAWVKEQYTPCLGVGPKGFMTLYSRIGFDASRIEAEK